MGKKYIIEIPEDKITDFVGSTHFLMPYMMAGHIGHHDTGLSIVPYTESDLEQVRKEAYQKGYETGYEDGYNEPGKNQQEAYQRGLADAWYAARKLYEIDWDVLCDLFGKVSVRSEVLDMFTAFEVLQKLKAYKQEQEKIKVGDEVENTQTGVKFIVTHLWKNNLGEQGVSGFNQECSAFSTTLDLVVKTGHAFPEIAAIFEKMRNESNEQIDT